jgi:hypothetical protein
LRLRYLGWFSNITLGNNILELGVQLFFLLRILYVLENLAEMATKKETVLLDLKDRLVFGVLNLLLSLLADIGNIVIQFFQFHLYS